MKLYISNSKPAAGHLSNAKEKQTCPAAAGFLGLSCASEAKADHTGPMALLCVCVPLVM